MQKHWMWLPCFALLVWKAKLHFLRETHTPDVLADGTSLLIAIPPRCLWFLCSSYYFLLFSHWYNSSCSALQQQMSHQPFNPKASADQAPLLNYLSLLSGTQNKPGGLISPRMICGCVIPISLSWDVFFAAVAATVKAYPCLEMTGLLGNFRSLHFPVKHWV